MACLTLKEETNFTNQSPTPDPKVQNPNQVMAPDENGCQNLSFPLHFVLIFFLLFFTAWSPALRDGLSWTEYLKFTFGGTARITRVRIGTPFTVNSIINRVVTKVRIEESTNCQYFSTVLEQGIPVNNIIEFPRPVVASVIKIVIIGADQSNQDASPIAVNE